MITRPKVLQELLDLYQNPSYLEVGVNQGATFHSLVAKTKVAVDPRFVFDRPELNDNVLYHEVTSDVYFGSIATESDLFDVIFLDGLHTFEQTLRDLINSVSHLRKNGVIVVDDVTPNSFQSSLPQQADARAVRQYLKQTDPSWMGDVYKLVFFVQSYFQKFSYATIENNHGQMVMWQTARQSVVPRDVGEFARLSFVDVVTKQDAFQLRPYADILKDVRLSLTRSASPKDEVMNSSAAEPRGRRIEADHYQLSEKDNF